MSQTHRQPPAGHRKAKASASPTAPRRPRRSREDLKAEILNSADQLFADRAYAALSIRDIAEAAGVPLPTLYRLFVDKRDIYQTCCQRAVEHQLGLGKATFLESDPPDVVVYKTMRIGYQFMDSNSTQFRLINRAIFEGEHQLLGANEYYQSESYQRLIRAMESVTDEATGALRLRLADALFVAIPSIISTWPVEALGITTADALTTKILSILAPNVDWADTARRC